MFYSDIVVPIPQKKRIAKNHRNTKPYVYEILARKGKDNAKDIVVCVGLAISDIDMNPNEKYFDLHPESKVSKPLPEASIFDDQIHIGSSMLLRASAKRIGLTQTLKNIFPGYQELIQSLLEYYILERDSTAQLFKFHLYDHFTELNYIPSDATISRFFNEYLTHDKIKEFLDSWLKLRLVNVKDTHIDIDFDSTNFNVHTTKIDSAEYGKAKVDEGLPQINVAYFLERKTGFPVYYDIYYGSIVDMEHCKTAVGKMRAVNPDVNATFVLDRGYFSSSNLNYFEENNYDYLCMGKSTSEFRTVISLYPYHRIVKSENWIYNTVYGVKEKRRVFKESSKEYYVYLYYDSSKINTELNARQSSAKYATQFLIGKRDTKGHIQETFGNLVTLEYDENKVITNAYPNHKKLNEFRDECGYFWIVSNEDMTAEEALTAYRHRDMIEKTFKTIKTETDLNKTYSSSDTAFESKNFMGFLAAIIRAELTLRLKPYFVQYSSESTLTVLKEMDKIKAECFNDKYRLRYALTNRQKQIMSFYDLVKDDVDGYVTTVNNNIALANNEKDAHVN